MSLLLLTGIPRSGTTLAAALLDQMDDAVCLSEPDEHVQLMEQSRDAPDFAIRLEQSMEKTRQFLLEGKEIVDRRQPNGSAITNYFDAPDTRGLRRPIFTIRSAAREGLSKNVLVCAKHNALYLAVLPELINKKAFRIIAMVRDPVSVLRSWQSLDLPISGGRLPAAERFWPELRRLGADTIPLLTKQIQIYDLICRRIIETKHGISVLRYEDLISDCAVLAKLANHDLSQNSRLKWTQTIDDNSRFLTRTDLYEAVREACSKGKADSLLKFYPQYA